MMGNEAAISKRSFSLSDGSVPEGKRKLLAWTNEYHRNGYLGLRKDSGGRLSCETSKKVLCIASLRNHIEKLTGVQAWLTALLCVRAF